MKLTADQVSQVSLRFKKAIAFCIADNFNHLKSIVPGLAERMCGLLDLAYSEEEKEDLIDQILVFPPSLFL
jgi:hypothetical protein